MLVKKENGAVAPTPQDPVEESLYPIIQDESGWEKQVDFAFTIDDPDAYPEEMEDAVRQAEEYVASLLESDHYFLEVLRGYTEEASEFPYSHDLKTGGVLYRWIGFATEDAIAKSDAATNGGASRYKAFCLRLRGDYLAVMNSLNERESIALDFGLLRDRYGNIDINSIGADITEKDNQEESGIPFGYKPNYADISEAPVPFAGIRRSQDMFNILHRLCEMGLDSEIKKIVGAACPAPLGSEEDTLDEVSSIAQYKVEKMAVNHAFVVKVLDGLVDIAYGKGSYQLKPSKTKTRSQESYELTASEKRCSKFFVENNANVEHAKAVISAVYTLRKDKRAEGFKHRGKIWFTEATIAREMLRTKQGTISNPDKAKATKKIIHDAIFMLSGSQISGTKPDGSPLAVDYVMNAVFRDRIKDEKGITYVDVWGFPDDATPLYSDTIGSVYDYPSLDLPTMKHTNVWMRGYLLDVLNQARANLYSGDKKSKRKSCKIERSWEGIFEKAAPLKGGQLPSKTKARIVSDMQEMLRAIAKDDCKGRIREDRPMSIKAWSTRDASRGRGKGAWDLLVIECKSSYHVFKDEDIDLIGD